MAQHRLSAHSLALSSLRGIADVCPRTPADSGNVGGARLSAGRGNCNKPAFESDQAFVACQDFGTRSILAVMTCATPTAPTMTTTTRSNIIPITGDFADTVPTPTVESCTKEGHHE